MVLISKLENAKMGRGGEGVGKEENYPVGNKRPIARGGGLMGSGKSENAESQSGLMSRALTCFGVLVNP